MVKMRCNPGHATGATGTIEPLFTCSRWNEETKFIYLHMPDSHNDVYILSNQLGIVWLHTTNSCFTCILWNPKCTIPYRSVHLQSPAIDNCKSYEGFTKVLRAPPVYTMRHGRYYSTIIHIFAGMKKQNLIYLHMSDFHWCIYFVRPARNTLYINYGFSPRYINSKLQIRIYCAGGFP